ncbi:hypothetical protein [Curvibacter phage PCA1]|nr:hypothetical protein [Curvibacter phage PCA1]
MNTQKFETGATSAPANNLVLSVMNDGNVYADRMHCGYALLQGANHKVKFIELVKNEARKQRAEGSKFKANEVSEAATLVQRQTIEHCLELLRDEYSGEKITIERRGWWDSVNGNTYWSTWITIPCNGELLIRQIAIPMSYGYGTQWQWDTVTKLHSIGFFPQWDKLKMSPNDLPVNFIDYGNGLKRNLYSGIYWGKPV